MSETKKDIKNTTIVIQQSRSRPLKSFNLEKFQQLINHGSYLCYSMQPHPVFRGSSRNQYSKNEHEQGRTTPR